MDIGSIKLAYDGLKSAKDIFSAFDDLKNEAESIAKVNEAVKQVGLAQDTLFELREELFRLQNENQKLREVSLERENWDKQFSNYELVTTEGGAVVYKSRTGVEHFICPSCVTKRQIHPLQDNQNVSGRFSCPSCSITFPVIKKENVAVTPIGVLSHW